MEAERVVIEPMGSQEIRITQKNEIAIANIWRLESQCTPSTSYNGIVRRAGEACGD
jgi:hypothetical protein